MMELPRVREVRIGPVRIGNRHQLVLVAGPAVLEDEDDALHVARELRVMARSLRIQLVFRASYDKPERSSGAAHRGPGLEAGLGMLERIRGTAEVPLVTDVHEPEHAARVAEVADALLVPSRRSRNTDLLRACAATGRPVVVSKAADLSPWQVGPLVEKVPSETGLVLMESGTAHGYGNLVFDPRSLPVLRGLGPPVIFDATRACRLPGAEGESSGGRREFAVHLARAAAAVGMDGLALDVHPDPDSARCDPGSQIPLGELNELLVRVLSVDRAVRGGTIYQ